MDRLGKVLVGMVLSGTLLGCANRFQSALHPTSPSAIKIAELWWFMLVVLGGYFLAVVGLLAFGLQRKGPRVGTRFIVVGGILLPMVVLVGLLVMTVDTTRALREPAARLRVEVIGHRWWWEVRYPDQGLVTANEIHLPAGDPVLLELSSADVIHSFWVPNLGGKMDMLPERPNRYWLQPLEAGVYRGQCAEYCGLQHARMAFLVIVQAPDEFARWLEARQQARLEPTGALQRRGRQVFFREQCDQCHSLRGTPAKGKSGPDLTHLGSRRTLGAATIPNTPGHLEGWIANPQTVKPGNLMPRTFLPPEDLHALRVYLESQE